MSVQTVQPVQFVQQVQNPLESSNVLNGLNGLNVLNESKHLVEIQGVSKSFHKTVKESTTEIKALSDVSLSIRENEFVSIIGPSGCGKTTLLKMIDGLIPYDSGRIVINGKPVTAPGPDRAVVFQSFALLPWRTVLANVEFSLELRQLSREERAKTARDYLKRVGLADFENHYPHELSGGMQQRAGLARALAVNPTILLMDEPFGAVDAQTRQLLQEELLELWQRERKTVIFITHSMAYVEASHYNLTNPKGAQKVLQKYLAIKDEKSIDEAYNEIVAKLTMKVPYPTEPGIQIYLDQLKIKSPKAAQAKPSDFTDVSFLKELESSGFIDKLYK